MIRDNLELYDSVRRLADDLDSLNQRLEADDLRNAMSSSIMLTEILGEIRNSARYVGSQCENEQAKKSAAEIIHYIDAVFNQQQPKSRY